MYPIIHMEVPK